MGRPCFRSGRVNQVLIEQRRAPSPHLCLCYDVRGIKNLKNPEIKILQASLDQIQKQLNAVHASLLFDRIPGAKERKELKLKNNKAWSNKYSEAKKAASQGD